MNRLLSTVMILEGITHIEDQPLDDFVRTVESIKDKIVTEKLDGSNLWFGLDENGVYTSREGKSPKKGRFYDVSDYPMISNYNGFRAAHLALEKEEDKIKKYLEVGDALEIEVLFGRQPNTVTYGSEDKNYIVILRGVNETPEERVKALSNALNGDTVNVESTVVVSPDGENLEFDDQNMTWQFTQVKPIDASKIDTSEVQALLRELKAYAAEKNEAMPDKTNKEVAEMSMTSVPKEQREAAKLQKAKVNELMLTKFKLPIKEMLLSKFVRKIKPFLQSDALHPSEDIGVEGVVIRDPESDEQIKIVDKDVFTAINSFNSAVRSGVSGLVRTTDQDSAIEMRGGVFGQAKIRIANLLGAKELALSSGVKRFITKFKKGSVQETAQALADSLNITSVGNVRTKAAAILKSSLEEIDTILDSFKNEAGEYKLMLKTGKEIGITPEVMKRTLTSFAETKKDIQEIISNISQATTPAELVMALYGRTIEAIFEGSGDEVKETFSLLRSIVEDGEGGAPAAGGDGGAAPPAATSAASTTAGNIAPVPFKLMGGKVVSRRARNFIRPRKFPKPTMGVPEGKGFSLMRSVNEDADAVKSMTNATDVDNSAAARRDIEFKQLRNNVAMSDTVNQMQVSKYLDKAHDLNNEVDTVTFGMETDDGDIVKVYVNAEQADQFEAALSGLLGKEDDIEKVVNDLAGAFDIVDVEWPASYSQAGTDSVEEPEAESEEGIALDSTEQPDIDFSLASDEEPETPEEDGEEEEESDKEEESEEESEDTDSEEGEESPEEEESSEESEENPEGEEEESEDTDEESEDEEAEEEDKYPTPKRKKKSKDEKTEESQMKTLGQLFKDKLLSEARQKKTKQEEPEEDPAVVAAREKFAKQMGDLLEPFPLKQEKAIITLMINLGVPIRALALHKADLRDTIEKAANTYLKSSSFRTWIRKFLETVASEDTVKEASLETVLSNKYQQVIYHVLKALGLPESVETTSNRALLAGIRQTATKIAENNDLRIYLMAIADELGVSDKVKDLPEPTKGNMKMEKPKMESVVAESADDAMTAVAGMLTTLGLDVASPRSLKSQLMMPEVKANMNKLGSSKTLMNKMNMLASMIGKVENPGKQMQQAGFEQTGAIVSEAAEGWSIGKLGSDGVMMSSMGMNIKMDADEAGKLEVGLQSGEKKFSVRAKSGKRFVFTKEKKGYNVKQLGDDEKLPDGLTLSTDEVDQILTLLAGE